eukprot:scaffold76588_cov99-Phaeocystis_antarctica.AAC.1
MHPTGFRAGTESLFERERLDRVGCRPRHDTVHECSNHLIPRSLFAYAKRTRTIETPRDGPDTGSSPAALASPLRQTPLIRARGLPREKNPRE